MNEKVLRTVKLSEICQIKYGKDHKKYNDGIIPVYGTGGIMRYIDNCIYDGESVLIPRKGTLDNIFYVNEKFWTIDTLFWTKINNKIIFPKYLYYFLKSCNLANMNVGSAVPSLTTELLNNLKIVLYDLESQKAIANILSPLDEKIELNNQMNETLEELAQTLYKQWFVDFEFPNENGEPYKSSGGKMVKSELGLIPEGWEVSFLGKSKLTKLLSSGINIFENEKVYLATADVSNTSINSFETNITFDDRPSRANMQPKENTVWFAKMKDSRKLIRVSTKSQYLLNECIFSTGFAGIKCNKSLNYIWSYLLTKKFDETKNSLSNGTTMQAINNSNINKIKIVIPSDNILSKYENLTESIFSKVEFNNIESITLAKTRDLLLPKLMSGEIRVPIRE